MLWPWQKHACSGSCICHASVHSLSCKHRAVLVAPEHAQLPSALGCIWLVIVSKLWGPQLCSQGIHSAVEVFGIQAC